MSAPFGIPHRGAVNAIGRLQDDGNMAAPGWSAAHGKRAGDWMQTYSGRQFWPLDPRPDEIFIEDIAHALSMQCRFGGHTLHFYSVAEHCVHLAGAVSPPNALWALLHDASEAYLSDIIRPIRPFLAGYKLAEAKLMFAVCLRFGLEPEQPEEISRADNAILVDERAIMAHCEAEWNDLPPEGIGIVPQCWEPAEAKRRFLAAFAVLTAGKASRQP